MNGWPSHTLTSAEEVRVDQLSLRCLRVRGGRGECDLALRSHTGTEAHRKGIDGFRWVLA